MHELSVTEQMLHIVLDHTQQAHAKQVLQVNLVIGELSPFVGESIQFYFDLLAKGTEAENAKLSISRAPVRARCRQCGNEFHPEGTAWACPKCGDLLGEVLAGREFYVDSIEVE